MNEKLRLDLDRLSVSTFVAQEVPTETGTVNANALAATHDISCKTVCFTTPCCPQTQTCP
jgi:hypothetical protein